MAFGFGFVLTLGLVPPCLYLFFVRMRAHSERFRHVLLPSWQEQNCITLTLHLCLVQCGSRCEEYISPNQFSCRYGAHAKHRSFNLFLYPLLQSHPPALPFNILQPSLLTAIPDDTLFPAPQHSIRLCLRETPPPALLFATAPVPVSKVRRDREGVYAVVSGKRKLRVCGSVGGVCDGELLLW
jgi:hypothetical protein